MNRFELLKKTEKRKIEKKEDFGDLDSILEGYRLFKRESSGIYTLADPLGGAKPITHYVGKDATMPQLEELAAMVGEFDDAFYFGAFASAYIREFIKENQKVTLNCQHFNKPVRYMGMLMEKGTVDFHGDAWTDFGVGMSGGKLVCHGDAGHKAGSRMSGGKLYIDSGKHFVGNLMSGGEIIVSEDTGDYLAECMNGGKITVHGNAGKMVGDKMQGGELNIKGFIEGIGMMQAGKVHFG